MITGTERDADLVAVPVRVKVAAVDPTMADTVAVQAIREDPIPDAGAVGASPQPYWRGLLSLV